MTSALTIFIFSPLRYQWWSRLLIFPYFLFQFETRQIEKCLDYIYKTAMQGVQSSQLCQQVYVTGGGAYKYSGIRTLLSVTPSSVPRWYGVSHEKSLWTPLDQPYPLGLTPNFGVYPKLSILHPPGPVVPNTFRLCIKEGFYLEDFGMYIFQSLSSQNWVWQWFVLTKWPPFVLEPTSSSPTSLKSLSYTTKHTTCSRYTICSLNCAIETEFLLKFWKKNTCSSILISSQWNRKLSFSLTFLSPSVPECRLSKSTAKRVGRESAEQQPVGEHFGASEGKIFLQYSITYSYYLTKIHVIHTDNAFMGYRLLTGEQGFDNLLELAIQGDFRNCDMLVKDIYGSRDSEYTSLGLSSTLIASSFGKAISVDCSQPDKKVNATIRWAMPFIQYKFFRLVCTRFFGDSMETYWGSSCLPRVELLQSLRG